MTAAATEDDILNGFDAIINDAERHIQRVAALKLTDHQKREFAAAEMKNEVWPMFAALARQVREAWLDHEETLEELLEGEGSVVQPELAAMIFANLQAGIALVTRVRKLKVNDLLRKELDKLCNDFETTAGVVDRAVADAAIEPEPPEEDEPQNVLADASASVHADPEDEDDDGEDDDDDEPTAPGEVG